MTTSNSPVVRVSILRCKAERFQEFEHMMTEAARILLPGIRTMQPIVKIIAPVAHD